MTDLVNDLREIVPEGEQPEIKLTFQCHYCGASKTLLIERELWLDDYAPKTLIDEVCYYCCMDLAEGIPV